MIDQGGQLLLRSPTIAQRVFGLDSPGQYVRSVPRTKFMFKAEFNLSAGAIDMLNNANLNTIAGPQSIAFKVKQIDKPKINLTTVELNQYNKKKLVYTKTDYSEASIRLHDTVDNSMLSLWINYFTYYFGDSRIKNPVDLNQNTVDPQFYDSTGWGLRPLSEIERFFDTIKVLAFYARTYTAFSYINPRITSIDWVQHDYASSDPEEVIVNFKYESIQYEEFGEPISDIETGFLPIDALELPVAQPAPLAILKPRMFNSQSITFNPVQQTRTTVPTGNSVLVTDPRLMATGSAVAPGATVPINLLVSAVTNGITTAVGGNPLIGGALSMVFNSAINNLGTTNR